MVIWKGGDNHCFFSAFDQSGDLGCCGTFGYSRELGGHLADTHWVQHCELAATSLNMIYSPFSLPPASLSCEAVLEKRAICAKRKLNYCSWKELIVGVVRVVQPFGEWPFPPIYDCQSNQRKIFLFILVSLFFH